MLTTRRRLVSASRFFASSSPASIRLANSISSSGDNREIFPISFRYMRTGSSTLMPSGTENSICSRSMSSSNSSSGSSSISSSFPIRRISILFASRKSKITSHFSESRLSPEKKSRISCSSRTLFFFLASAKSRCSFSSNPNTFSSICPTFP